MKWKSSTLDDLKSQYCNRNCIGCSKPFLATAGLSCFNYERNLNYFGLAVWLRPYSISIDSPARPYPDRARGYPVFKPELAHPIFHLICIMIDIAILCDMHVNHSSDCCVTDRGIRGCGISVGLRNRSAPSINNVRPFWQQQQQLVSYWLLWQRAPADGQK